MGEQLSEANRALIEREVGLSRVETVGGCISLTDPARLEKLLNAARSEGPHPESGEEGVVRYVLRYGGMCRGCADADGVCPTSGLPCASDDARKAVAWVLDAVAYGTKHGYLPAASPPPLEGVGIMAHMPSRERLREKIAADPDADCEAGPSSKGEALPVVPIIQHQFHTFCQPATVPHQVWMLRFCDQDMGDMIWGGPDAREQAVEAWNRYNVAWNCYLFSALDTAALSLPRPASDKGEEAPVAWRRVNNVNPERVILSDRPMAQLPFNAARWTETPLYARPVPGVSRETVARKAADYFGWRPFDEMAKDKADLRLKIRTNGSSINVNEPTQGDCLDFADALALLSRGEG